ncbi:MAG: phospholipase D-like domain-containing protein [Saprospiraceae bacterium]|nr:phospholipase D-like domain-containing protein [Saprospiraceae bacterium]
MTKRKINQKIYFNPITKIVSESINESKKEFFIAVPFISSFAKSILNEERLSKIKSKKLLTCFNEFNLNSFDLDTLSFLLANGVEIRFNNEIHLKLYLFENNGFISSSNLTKSGFENSIEITSTIEKENLSDCKDFFDKLWQDSVDNQITEKIIKENYPKYLLLKKRTQYKKPKQISITSKKLSISNIEIEDLIDYLFKADQDYSYYIDNAFEANKDREEIKSRIKKGFKIEDFHAPIGSSKREESLFYKLLYGREGFIAGTGLREKQFQEPFENEKFPEIISYIYPPIIGGKDWNLDDDNTFEEYCNGIFEYRIPQYAETLPIRLASYFYPDSFFPIFKLNDLEKICKILGLETDAKSKGDRLYVYNSFLSGKMKSIPFDNYIKASIAYLLYFTVELYERISNGEEYETILSSYTQNWRKDNIKKGKSILEKIIPDLTK